MSMVSGALRNEQTHAGGTRAIAGIVNSFETLEGGGFLFRRPFPEAEAGVIHSKKREKRFGAKEGGSTDSNFG